MKMSYLASVLAAAANFFPACGQTKASSHPATTGFLYSYDITSLTEFDAAYKAHLDWHRQAGDHLAWYGWYVSAGPKTGTFVDGTFGSTFEDIDHRPKIVEDGRHFAQGAGLYSKPIGTTAWQLWSEVSTTFTLEDQMPSASVDVLRLSIKPSVARAFEDRLARLAASRRANHMIEWTWYRGIVGQKHPEYLILIPRDAWADLSGRGAFLGKLIEQTYGVAGSGAWFDDSVLEMTSETWRYRSDLSYIPARQGVM